MKKLMSLSVLTLLGSTLIAGNELEIKPSMWRVSNAKVTENAEVLKAESTSHDPYLSHIVKKTVDCAGFNAVVFELQIPATEKTQSVQIFWNTTESKGLKEAASIHLPLERDGKLHRCTVILAGQPFWSGTLKEFRIDPVSSKLPFALGKVKLEQDVELFAWKGVTIQKNEGDEISGTFSEKNFRDPSILTRIPGKGLPAKAFGTLEFEIALDPGCSTSGQVFWSGDVIKKLSEKASLRFNVAVDGEFHKVKLNLAAKPEWKGMIQVIRLDMTENGAAGKSYRIKDVKLKAAKAN